MNTETDITQPQLDNLSLSAALANSLDRRAVYEHDRIRVFVSERGANYDYGVRAPGRNQLKTNQAPLVLHELLVSLHVSKDSGWRPA